MRISLTVFPCVYRALFFHFFIPQTRDARYTTEHQFWQFFPPFPIVAICHLTRKRSPFVIGINTCYLRIILLLQNFLPFHKLNSIIINKFCGKMCNGNCVVFQNARAICKQEVIQMADRLKTGTVSMNVADIFDVSRGIFPDSQDRLQFKNTKCVASLFYRTSLFMLS